MATAVVATAVVLVSITGLRLGPAAPSDDAGALGPAPQRSEMVSAASGPLASSSDVDRHRELRQVLPMFALVGLVLVVPRLVARSTPPALPRRPLPRAVAARTARAPPAWHLT